MKKILFLLACLWLVLPFPSRAEKAASSVSAANGESEELKIIPLRPTGDPLVNTSSGLEEYWFRLFMLYRHFDQKFPGGAIEGDLKDEIRKQLPRLTPQEVYDQEEYIRFVIKNYRGIRSLIEKYKMQALMPEEPALIVDPEELEPYDEPYIESDNELVVIYDPRRVIPYASDRKNFRAVEASLEHAKKKSATRKKFDELRSQLSLLELKKIPFYNSIYDDPFSGDEGMGDWAQSGKLQARILSSKAAVGSLKKLKAAVNLYPATAYIIPDEGENTFKIDFTQSENVEEGRIFRPLPRHFYIQENGNTLSGYNGSFLLPLEITVKNPGQPVKIATEISLRLCDKNNVCHSEKVSPRLTLESGEARASTMFNYVEQNFNMLPRPESKKLQIIKTAVYDHPDGGQMLKIRFRAKKSAKQFEFFINNAEGIKFSQPAISVNNDEIDVLLTPQEQESKLDGKEFEVTAKLDNRNIIRTLIRPEKASFFDTELPVLGWGIIGLAVLGGFILNFMPCVFPVLALKVLALTKFGGCNPQKVRSGFLYTLLGLAAAFAGLTLLLICLKALGYALGWGMQFQSTGFLLFISFVIAVFLLQLWGQINLNVPQWSERILRSPHRSENALNFMTGLLLVLLATPCSAPYLGTAIGFALAGTYSDIAVIMAAVGFGLGLPYLLLFLKPVCAAIIPHPGKWLRGLHLLMGAMLLLTLLWLLSVLAAQTGLATALRTGLYLLLFMGIWSFYKIIAEEIDKRSEPPEMRRQVIKFFRYAALFLSLLLIVLSAADVLRNTASPRNDNQNIPVTRDKQEEISQYLRENRAVLIAVGADWCLTCKFNDFLTLNNYKIRNMIADGRLVLLRSDWTAYDKKTLEFMEKYGRKGVPFYILYSPKFPNGMVLPEVLNESDFSALIRDVRFNGKATPLPLKPEPGKASENSAESGLKN